mmetsp:Transcript_15289/g.32785  ORF Transcript_15289/g.32785 Transcript_15289/m.32785 type:complete len:99 (-) Transcript_15289:728-1024(-)
MDTPKLLSTCSGLCQGPLCTLNKPSEQSRRMLCSLLTLYFGEVVLHFNNCAEMYTVVHEPQMNQELHPIHQQSVHDSSTQKKSIFSTMLLEPLEGQNP